MNMQIFAFSQMTHNTNLHWKRINFISKSGVTSTSTMYLNVDIVQYKQICMGDVNNKEMIIKRISWHEWTKASIK